MCREYEWARYVVCILLVIGIKKLSESYFTI